VAKTAKKSKGMSEAHKEALAKGREEGRKVRAYLEALAQEKQAGRRQDPDVLQLKINEQQQKVDAEPNAAKRLELIQRRLDLEEQLAAQDDQVDLEQLEKDFIEAIPGYAERKGITYSALREAGVPASVLKQAGVKRTRRTA
jgi:hypothetical protein